MMKKLLCSLCLLLLLVCMFVACDTQKPHLHSYTDWTVTKPASCTEAGEESGTCSTCGATATRKLEILPHNYIDCTVIKSASCTEAGAESGTCSVCGVTGTRELEILPHSYTDWTVTKPASCTEAGAKSGTCSVCGATGTRELEILPHSYADWTVTKPASCTEEGEEKRSCTCGACETRKISMGSGTHDFRVKEQSAAYLQTAGTCQSVPVYYYKCANCAAKGTETFDGDGLGDHSFTAKIQSALFFKSAASCESPALYYYKCAYCNAKGEDTYTVGEELHKFTAKVQTDAYLKSPATCKAHASYYYKCTLCDKHNQETYEIGGYGTHDMDANNICNICFNAFVYFGEYPQSLKADGVTITQTTDARGYYLGSDGAYYAKVVAAPCSNDATFSTGASAISGTEYYFKVEPIRWRILSQADDVALIFCDSIIANKAYDNDDSYYVESDIRAWLNDEFYRTAFSALEQEMILSFTIEEDVNDKVFLLGFGDVCNIAYGFSSDHNYSADRSMKVTDYSLATGGISTIWWLRNMSGGYRGYTVLCGAIGGYNTARDYYPDESQNGVVPALQIRLN